MVLESGNDGISVFDWNQAARCSIQNNHFKNIYHKYTRCATTGCDANSWFDWVVATLFIV